MSLPNYLAKIKSAGIYRFVWDKSQAPIQAAETLRLVVGYSEKGPFNTPVYIDNTADFKTIFGGISKKLEKRGVYFHRMALQALEVGPILALNLKKFTSSVPATENQEAIVGEQVNYIGLNPSDQKELTVKSADVMSIYNTDRFWSLDPDVLPSQLGTENDYITITSTDSKETSCTMFVRQYKPTGYDVTVKTWYANQKSVEMPTYLEDKLDMMIEDTFMEVYVFRGKFTPEIAKTSELSQYFTIQDDGRVMLTDYITNAFGEPIDALEALASDDNSNFIQVYRGTTLPYFKDMNGNYISLDLAFNKDNSVHKMLMKINEDVIENAEPGTNPFIANEFFQPKQLPFALDYAEYAMGEVDVENKGELARIPIYLEGYTYNTITKGDKGRSMQETILSTLTDYVGMRLALTNNIDVEYHYIVDTFETYPGVSMKAQLASLAKEKDNCLAILNFPFMSSLTKDNTYKDPHTKVFKASLLKGRISLPTANEGASWCAFYTAMNLSDGTVKTTCPSAAVVSNNFMAKYDSRQPYSIVAGPNYGLISAAGLVGPDYNFARVDLDFFEPFGVNCLVYVPRVGTQINSNQTAKQTPVSALSKVHVRELVIYIQDTIANMLQGYQWEFNTQTLRDTVKAKADKILENIQQNGGVYTFVNVCDETNNTDDVINNEMLVLSTSIEPGMGAGKLVEELTIYRKGGMSSSAI